jgi:hypothetical protein
LVSAIENTRYASTVRASVRRFGDWYNLDYYHHLAYGVRKVAVAQIGSRIAELKVIIGNLAADEDLSPAKEFLDGIIGRVDAAVDDACKRIQSAGREAFIQFLSRDHAFWGQCENRWGGGPGYRTAIRDMTESEIETQADEVESVIHGLIMLEWNQIIGEIEALLQQQAGSSPDRNAPPA